MLSLLIFALASFAGFAFKWFLGNRQPINKLIRRKYYKLGMPILLLLETLVFGILYFIKSDFLSSLSSDKALVFGAITGLVCAQLAQTLFMVTRISHLNKNSEER